MTGEASRRYFGTDGIRGRLGQAPITPEFVLHLGWAAGRVLTGGRRGAVLIGKDTRISGYLLESALEAGLAAAGADIYLLGPMPSPAIAYLTRSMRAHAGIVISASHNPYPDNGIKFFCADGSKLPESMELDIERELAQPCKVVSAERLGKAARIDDAPRRYIEFCKQLFESGPRLDGVHVLLDCAHGATYHIAPRLFNELGAKVEVIGADPNGFNINRNCGAVAPQGLCEGVRARGATIGIAFDGDGDRVIMADDKGEIVDGDELLYIIAGARREFLNGGVVGTVASNLGLEHALRKLDLRLHRAAVGDRYVSQYMSEHGLRLGGENSGHIIDLDYTNTGDGIVTALQVLDIMLSSDCTLADLKSGMSKLPQCLRGISLPRGGIGESQLHRIHAAEREASRELGEHGRVLVRPSGTEPLLRVLVEGPEATRVELVCEQLTTHISELLNNPQTPPQNTTPPGGNGQDTGNATSA